MAAKPKTALPMVSGLLLLVAGAIWIIEAALLVAGTSTVMSFIPDVAGLGSFITGVVLVIAIIGIILAAVVLLGGYFAISRRHFALALLGSIFGLAAIGPYGIASILSLVALILLAVSHHEFE